jgi:hypothetical protein
LTDAVFVKNNIFIWNVKIVDIIGTNGQSPTKKRGVVEIPIDILGHP